MREMGKSTLLKKTGKLMGFGYGQHPLKADWYMNVVIYRTDTDYVLCISELPKSQADPAALRKNLGTDVPGAAFAPYAARAIDVRFPFAQLKETLKELNANIEWFKE